MSKHSKHGNLLFELKLLVSVVQLKAYKIIGSFMHIYLNNRNRNLTFQAKVLRGQVSSSRSNLLTKAFTEYRSGSESFVNLLFGSDQFFN